MRWTFLFLALLGSACQYHTDCDERVKELYPDSTLETIDLGNKMVLYWRNRSQFVLCEYGHAQLEIRTLTVSAWGDAYCKNFTNPPACKEQLEKGTLP